MTGEQVRVSAAWLDLREPADAAARSLDLVRILLAHWPADRPTVVHDLGAGSGSMGRWLAPHLPGPQHWVLHDRDGDLLALAAVQASTTGDAGGVTLETRQGDLTRLPPDDLANAALVTASALLDMLTADELRRFVHTCVAANCPALVTLSVIGGVRLHPIDPLDEVVAAAFNEHQQRTTGGRALLGPRAFDVAVELFGALGWRVEVRASPWELGPESAPLIARWFAGWVDAACEQRPELAAAATAYRHRRSTQLHEGRLAVTVAHRDLLALPPHCPTEPSDSS